MMKAFGMIDIRSPKALGLIVLAALILAAGIAATFYFYGRASKDPDVAGAEEIVQEVEKIMLLPKGEIPTVATVTNPEQLRAQPFFANAQEGYKVLVYLIARKAILYDPESRRIIEVAPLTPGTSSPGAPVGTTPGP